MGALLDKVIQVLKIMPFILYFKKNNKIKLDSAQEQIEDEWGQFCDISLPISIEAHPKGATR